MTNYLKYKSQMAVLDADDTEIESWITVRGNHIPIKKGQSKEEAVKSFLESKGGNSSGTKTESFSQSKKISWADTPKFFNEAKKKYDVKNHLDKDKNLIHTFHEKGTGNIVGEYNNTTHTLHYNEEPKEDDSKLWEQAYKNTTQGASPDKTYGPTDLMSPDKIRDFHEKQEKDIQAEYERLKNESKAESKEDDSWGGSHPKFDKLTEEYMPDKGEADNELGEILRSINRVAYRYYNDGDRWNQGYGKETVNWAVNYLAKVSKKEGLPNDIADGLTNGLILLKGSKAKNKYGYEQGIKTLIQTLEHASESDLDTLSKMKTNTKKATDSWNRLWGKK